MRLSRERKQEIERMAEWTRLNYFDGKSWDFEKLAKDTGICFSFSDRLKVGIAQSLIYGKDGLRNYVSSPDSFYRPFRDGVVLHEFGHHFLGHLVENWGGSTDTKEAEADYFFARAQNLDFVRARIQHLTGTVLSILVDPLNAVASAFTVLITPGWYANIAIKDYEFVVRRRLELEESLG